MANVPEEKSTGNASIPPLYISIFNTKFEVEKFDRKSTFSMWRCEVMDMLVQINLDFTLEAKPEDLDDKNREMINHLAYDSIRLCLVKDQKYIFFKTKLCKGIMASTERQVYKEENRESSLLEEEEEEEDLSFPVQERHFHEWASK
ncbi:hypothetical protein OIU79_011606 [Salix purpurea]|uniref:Uncharacterized protein n=1 Tax=Salix purpurea TaxID=77065 RepID=A0A9Q0T2E3_SALPP|nr:hypothetical protein OIU79_011606 [Salix purpurea]